MPQGTVPKGIVTEPEPGARDLAGSPDRFGYEWNAYSEILPEYEEQFRRWTVHLPLSLIHI